MTPRAPDHEAAVPLSGSLSPAERREAAAAAVTLVGRYFVAGREPTAPREALGQRPGRSDDTDELLVALRLRVALAASRRLRTLLDRILGRATFRYRLQQEESTGQLTGALDVNRYLTRLGVVADVPSYPVLVPRRSEVTPENVLATYAVHWLLRELRTTAAAAGIPATGEERRRFGEERQALERVLRLPAFQACDVAARGVKRRRAEQELVGAVRRRLRRREIANPTAYRALVDWVDRVMSGEPVAGPGDLEWEIYEGRFDTKLFELWCLRLLAEEISAQLVSPVPEVDPGWRRGRPAYTWHQFAGTIEVHFQRSPATISRGRRPRWLLDGDPAQPLKGVPDIVVRTVSRDGTERFAVVDPKLRQRSGAPTEELYKVLGYQNNFDLGDHPLAAVLHHGPAGDDLGDAEYTLDGKPGSLFAIRLSPAAHAASRRASARLASAVLGMLDIPRLDVLVADEDDDSAERGYQAAKRELMAYGEALGPGVLDHSRHRMRMELGDERWNALDDTVRTMLTTADHIGFALLGGGDASRGSDFSGAVIGICAGVESILHDHLVTPALADRCERSTLGKVIALVEEAVQGSDKPDPRDLRAFLDREGFALGPVGDLVEPLRRLSRRYRNPAAHRTLVTRTAWTALWRFTMTEERLLPRVIDVIARPPDAGEG